MKNALQLPSIQSTKKPLLDAINVRPNTPSEAIRAYCEAEKAWLHNREINATKATELQAAVKPSTNMVAANKGHQGKH